MTTKYSVSSTIDAQPDKVWALLTDASSYRDWNDAVVSIEGTIAPGEKIKLVSVVNPKRAFTLNVTECDAPRRMVWADSMPLGLFKGVRTYRLTPRGDQTELSMEEVFSGPLALLITRTIPDLTDSFELFAGGLKSAAERGR
ncbi:MAG: SRPBCC domain-containing protein [Pseudonocardiales bacterium]|nr:SRPBCC domain-containing protein [Pseudonocardiales bacterium]